MFEYINPLVVLVTILVVLASMLITLYEAGRVQVEGTKFKIPYILYIGTVIMVIMLFFDLKDSKIKYKNTMHAFNTNKPLYCIAVGLNRIISKEKGWSRFDKDHFTNGDEIIQSRFCEVLDKKSLSE